jgi:hypothetical protein
MLRRATAMTYCSTLTKVRSCTGCNTPRVASGRIDNAGGVIKSCNARTCAACQRGRAARLRKYLLDAVQKVPAQNGYRWRFVTLTARWDAANPFHTTVAGLRSRVRAMIAAVRLLWKKGLKQDGSALFFALELAGTGFVHGHCLYYGPFLDKDWMERTGKLAHPDFGHVDLKSPATDADAVRDIAKYCTKGTSVLREDYLDDAAGFAVHPRLAARWEAATLSIRLCERYGALRKLKMPDPPGLEDEPEDGATPCRECGTVGCWKTTWVNTTHYIQFCHLQKTHAFSRADWLHPAEREREWIWSKWAGAPVH